MIDFYNEQNLSDIKKKYNFSLSWMMTFLFSFLTGEALFIVLANYELMILFIVLACVYGLAITFLFIYFTDRRKYYSVLLDEYTAILYQEPEAIKCTITNVSEKPITLNDSTLAYEVTIKIDDKEKIVYLSNIIDNTELKTDQEVTLYICFNYIRGISYDN